MRIILIGQAAFAEKVLDGICDRRHTVPAVYAPPDSGGRPDPLTLRAQALGIPVRQHRTLKGTDVQREFASLGADLAVLAYVTRIVPPSVFETPRLGSVCFHPSLLPRYRGGSAINWQIIKGETETGVSVFWVDAGIDTGPIVVQEPARIRPNDTAGSLYYDILFPLGIAAVMEAIDLIAAGTAPRLPQDESQASYDPLCRDEHVGIDWSRPATTIYNLIRGSDPQPGAYTTLRGERLRLYDAALVSGGDLRSGMVEAIDQNGWMIGAPGGGIRVRRVRGAEKKMDAVSFASAHAISVGTALGT